MNLKKLWKKINYFYFYFLKNFIFLVFFLILSKNQLQVNEVKIIYILYK